MWPPMRYDRIGRGEGVGVEEGCAFGSGRDQEEGLHQPSPSEVSTGGDRGEDAQGDVAGESDVLRVARSAGATAAHPLPSSTYHSASNTVEIRKE